MGMGATRPQRPSAGTGRAGIGGGMTPMPVPPMAFLQANYPGAPTLGPTMPPGAIQGVMGMAAGGYIPEGGFGQSPYNMGMNQMDPYAPMPTYMGQNPYGFVNGSSLAGGGTVGYMNGGPVGYPASAPQAAGIASLPLPRRYGL
jgi:hypothetical protein